MFPQLTVERFDFFSHRTRTRFPFRYGIARMTEVPHLFVQAQVRVDGRTATGIASEGLPPKWFTKNPDTTFESDLSEMLLVIGHAARLASDAVRKPQTFYSIWKQLYQHQAEWAHRTHRAPLLANLGVSLSERALLDALCRALETPIHRLILENHLGLVLGEIHSPLRGSEPGGLLPETPLPGITVRHTLGLADPLTPEDIPLEERVDDGLPQDLQSCIRASRLRAFKVKLFGEMTQDLPRLKSLAALLARETKGDFLLTLDANEHFQDIADFRDFWSQLAREPDLHDLLLKTLVVEQPVHRDKALSDEVAVVLGKWTEHPPLIIDESDGGLDDLPRALALGYAGTSHKNCKGIIKGIANACLLEHFRRRGRSVVLTGEDLCNLGPVALQQDLALMALLAIPHVERNGHHYFRGLTPWPEDWQETVRAAHPDLYVRDALGFVRVQVNEGRMQLGTVNAAPFGLAPSLDPSRFPRVNLSGRTNSFEPASR